MSHNIPFFDLVLGDEEKLAVAAVLDSNWLSAGPRLRQFELDFSTALGISAENAIAVSNGTVALHLAMTSLGIGPGDEVICPSLTFVATANAARYTGAIPVFADVVSQEDWTIDPVDIAKKITPKTKAITVMHYGGYTCDMRPILDLAERHNLFVIEDACHGILAEWEGRKLGTIGDVGCFSFFSNKNMTSAEGGMVIARDPEIAKRVRVMQSHGITPNTDERYQGRSYDVTELGFNYRMDEIRAALAIEQFKKLPAMIERRKQIVNRYRASLSQVQDLIVPFKDRQGSNGYHLFPVTLPASTRSRGDIMDSMAEQGIATNIHFRPIHTLSIYKEANANLPVTNDIEMRMLTLPLYPSLADNDCDVIAHTLKKCLSEI